MYETRLQVAAAAQDENKRAEAKMLPTNKGASALHQANNNRRALGDIGNLVGALSARCIVSKDNPQQENLAAVALPPAPVPLAEVARIDRPITRKFGANLANNLQQLSHPQVAVPLPCAKEDSEAEALENELPVSWRTKQRRTMGHPTCREPAAIQSQLHSQMQVQESNPVSSVVAHPRTRVSSTRGMVAALKKKQTLTATLTARSEAARGGSEVEMEEAEDSLPNIDENDVGNQLAVVDYVEDIYTFYRKTEIQSCVPSDYMSKQADINENMRAILVDWLIEVHLKFKLMPETLYLTTNLIDRFLASETVLRKHLQLVGVTAMLLASKYEEIWAPEVQDFVIISDNAYTREQVLDMEKLMLNKLKFNLTVPTPYVFLVRFLKAAGSDTQLEMMAFFLTELCLTEYSMMRYCPSLLAAAAVYTAMQTLKRTPTWSTTLQCHSSYTEMHLRDCATKMVTFHQHAKEGNLTVVHKKYSNPKFSCVATLEPALFLIQNKHTT